LRPLRLCVRIGPGPASLAKIAKTSLLNSVQFFFASLAALREDESGSLAKIAKGAKETFCLPLRKSGTSIKI
jgi:hypothetical protein